LIGVFFDCQNPLVLRICLAVEISMRKSIRARSRSRCTRISIGTVVAVLAAGFAPVAAIAAAQPLEMRFAYLDPGTGSLILQAVVAGLAGAAVAITTYWARIRRLFRRGSRDSEPPDTAPRND
jgi:hypothetical protein